MKQSTICWCFLSMDSLFPDKSACLSFYQLLVSTFCVCVCVCVCFPNGVRKFWSTRAKIRPSQGYINFCHLSGSITLSEQDKTFKKMGHWVKQQRFSSFDWSAICRIPLGARLLGNSRGSRNGFGGWTSFKLNLFLSVLIQTLLYAHQ